jgi:cell wall-associated NlpC family hydrolase
LDPGDLQPGDLVFGAKNLSDPSTIYHVGMYIGAGNMIVAHIPAPWSGSSR